MPTGFRQGGRRGERRVRSVQMSHEFPRTLSPVRATRADRRRYQGRRLTAEAKRGFIGAPEYGQARVTPPPDPSCKTADINHPEREKTPMTVSRPHPSRRAFALG